MKLWVLLAFFLIKSDLSFAQKRDCFRQHLLEAIAINQSVMVPYGRLSNGASDKIFSRLIRAERIGLLLARYFDRKARLYHAHDIPLLCEEFPPLEQRLSVSRKDSRPLDSFQEIDWKKYVGDFNQAMRLKDFTGLKNISALAITELKSFPSYYCMLRHIFESIYRISHFAPLRIEAARAAGLPSPEKLLLRLIGLHVKSLNASVEIDQWSAPLQAEGIPVLCSLFPDLLHDLKPLNEIEP